ncbi:ERMES complex subunit mmm1 [Lunasporangiospora selenospora]|uniref:Maintenance of mitochondrial morphology protein 1 n=1 Tax=Lunasporangiospora selenospora TaxID=979761 RepID=A0A9P6FRA0_9FUNG|nr:ERMES complex subunit mmm1 [Lunasporangiospora selenospora]
MANHVQVLGPEGGQDYLIEIANLVDRFSHSHMHNHNNSSGMSFTMGLLLGQLSVVVIVIVCFKYLLLEDVRYGRKPRSFSNRGAAIPAPPTKPSLPSTTTILNKTFYDVHDHPPESLDWMSVLFAQAIAQYRDDSKVNNRLIKALAEALNGGVRPDWVGHIRVTELNLGEDFPRAEIDLDFNDQIMLGIETSVLINWPRPRIAALPVSLVLSVIKFQATITLQFNTIDGQQHISISTLPDFDLEFGVQSLLGARTKLEDVPKVTDLITSKLRSFFIDKCVYPNGRDIAMPTFWAKRDIYAKSQSSSSTSA